MLGNLHFRHSETAKIFYGFSEHRKSSDFLGFRQFLYYLLQEITIVQIFAVMLFIALMAAMGISAYAREFVPLAKKLLKDRNILRKAWLLIVIWIILLIWAFKELFF